MRFGGFNALLYYLRGVNEILPTYCYICHPTLLTFGPEDVQTVLTFGPEDVQTVLTFGPEDVQT